MIKKFTTLIFIFNTNGGKLSNTQLPFIYKEEKNILIFKRTTFINKVLINNMIDA